MKKWVKELVHIVSESVYLHGPHAGFDFRYIEPNSSENPWPGYHCVSIAPDPQELIETGPNDGMLIPPKLIRVHLFDLAPNFDSVHDAYYEKMCDCCERSRFVFIGDIAARKVVVQIITLPFNDAKPHLVIDGKTGEVRLKKGARKKKE